MRGKKSDEKSYEKKMKKRYKRQFSGKRRRNFKPLVAALVLIAFWYLVIGKDILPQILVKSDGTMVTETIAYESPCYEANLAKCLALILQEDEKEVINSGSTDNTEANSQLDEEKWYSEYYRVLEEKKITGLKEENALQNVNEALLSQVLSQISDRGYAETIEEGKKSQLVTLQEVIRRCQAEIKKRDGANQIEYIELAILVTPADGGKAAWQIGTNQGNFGFKGLIIEPLKNKTIKVAVKGKELLGVMEIVSEESEIKACTLEEITEAEIKVKVGEDLLSYKNSGIDKQLQGSSGTLRIKGDEAIAYEENQLESGTLTGNQVIDKSDEEDLRVLLSNEEGGYEHKWVKLAGSSDYEMYYDGKTNILPKDEAWDSEQFKWEKGADTITFVPKEESTLKLFMLKKQGEFPEYNGSIEVTKTEKGYVVINVVDLEAYVAGVIPSEMPTSYGLEALKVQAVAARTYAIASKQGSKFISYGAQIDDTTASQVYNNVVPNDLAYKAARETAGEILMDNGEVISSKFFATSCGYTASSGEVWAVGDCFPSESPDYLVAMPQYKGKELVDNMQEESNAYKFLTLTPEEIEAYDEESPWFRWQVTLSQEELGALIEPAMKELSSQPSDEVKILKKDGSWVAEKVYTLGKIKDLQVIERGKGGNIMTLRIDGTKASVKVSTEYMIRKLFASNSVQSLDINRGDGSKCENMGLLPSSFFAPKITYDNNKVLKSVTLYGGGFGHGVGMSQDGVRGMAEKGFDYKEIIAHFYQGVEITNLEK